MEILLKTMQLLLNQGSGFNRDLRFLWKLNRSLESTAILLDYFSGLRKIGQAEFFNARLY